MPQKINVDLLSEEERRVIEARRAYQKQWREKKPEKVKEKNRRFWLKKAAEQSQ